MTDKDEKHDNPITDRPMKAKDRIWGDELEPGTIEIEHAVIEDDTKPEEG